MTTGKLLIWPGLMAILFLSICTISAQCGAEVYMVDDDEGADFSTISEAIDAAANGDMIQVAQGTYEEVLSVNKSLLIIGETGGGTEIREPENGGQGNATDPIQAVVVITSDGVQFQNFEITKANGIANYPGLVIRDSQNVTAMNCSLSGLFLGGVLLDDTTGAILENCTLEGLLHMNNVQSSTIRNASIRSWIDIGEGSGGTLIENSVCESLVMVTGNSHGNVFLNNSFDGMYIGSSDGNRAENNRVNQSISIFDSLDTHLSGNSFTIGGIHFSEGGSWYEMFLTTKIMPSNTINGKEIFCLVEGVGASVPEDAGQVIIAFCDSTLVEGLEIDGGKGILLYNSSNSRIRSSSVRGTINGVVVSNCTGTEITNVTISDAIQDGMMIRDGGGIVIRDVTVMNCSRFGIKIDSDLNASVEIVEGHISNNGIMGLWIRADGIVVRGVRFEMNQEGISVEGDWNRITDVEVKSCVFAGMRIIGNHNSVDYSFFSGTEDGIIIEGGNQTTIQNSAFEKNGNGIRITQWSGKTIIMNCSFHDHKEYGIVIANSLTPDHGNTLSGNSFEKNEKGNVLVPGGEKEGGSDSDEFSLRNGAMVAILLIIFSVIGGIALILQRHRPPPPVP
jgi:parallel beta-helix repeat protein